MSAYIVPVIIISLILYSLVKRNNTYNSFVVGAKSSFDIVMISFPYIVAIFVAKSFASNTFLLLKLIG